MSPATKKIALDHEVEKTRHYPTPLASHDKIVEDPITFWDTLRRFHSLMSTKFMIPVIGGRELDLHILYVEATKRGGYEKVVADKKWREVGSVFKFSPTTTSASFVLRKHYFGLLYHYEQVHFFKVQGPMSSSAAAFPGNSTLFRPELAIVEYSPEVIKHRPEPPSEGSSSFSALGTIDGKFDCGYLVSVRVGSEVLSGVLYHPDQPQHSFSSISQCNDNALIPYTGSRRRDHSARRRRRRSRRAGDPSYPKPNRSGYNFFFAEKHYKLKSLYPNREREFTKIIGQSWSNLSAEERMVYQNIGLKDKERYKRELKEYKERLKLRETMELELQKLGIDSS
ncbi:high mobility group B protein 9 [Ricinus communis]|uniref:Transcription factor, putative n=1 Tax=Ricinus communis TaxID=3988 RepID=B9R8H2_RICCO|nr:high mobility group B protein 9 [Ricinus communis]EEF52802.1 transcription factor, putative [Ricinus communis]|eukprot:XP_002510615.1 high mobility group B protein 9 [Ricinus communis]